MANDNVQGTQPHRSTLLAAAILGPLIGVQGLPFWLRGCRGVGVAAFVIGAVMAWVVLPLTLFSGAALVSVLVVGIGWAWTGIAAFLLVYLTLWYSGIMAALVPNQLLGQPDARGATKPSKQRMVLAAAFLPVVGVHGTAFWHRDFPAVAWTYALAGFAGLLVFILVILGVEGGFTASTEWRENLVILTVPATIHVSLWLGGFVGAILPEDSFLDDHVS